MRLIGTFKDQKTARDLSALFDRYGIVHQLDVETNKDWGSVNYGDTLFYLWVVDEDQMDDAIAKMTEFMDNPQQAMEKAPSAPKKNWLEEPIKEKIKEVPLKMIREKKLQQAAQTSLGPITTGILILCTLLLLISTFTMPQLNNIPENLPYNMLLTPRIEKVLMYDYPKAYEILDKIINAYGIDSFQNPNEMPPQEKLLIQTFNNTPFFKGFYNRIVDFFTKGESPWNIQAPLFEKIREGQVWRLLTPVFLHYDIFHLFFNMIWLIVLGKQMEQRLGVGRYIFFIVLTGVISNTLQYLMTGPNFIGFSGVLCAMLTFVWMRQKKAAWEGYQMQSSTFTFVMVFIIAMFGIQLVSFLMEIYTKSSFSPVIANTAHLSGALMGAFLGRLDFFAYKNR
jgi:GlpG protein